MLSAAHFRADWRQAGTRCHALITERLCATLDIVDTHCTPVHSLPLSLALTSAVVEHRSTVIPASKSQRRADCRRRNQSGCGGKDQTSGRAKAGEQHVDTARCPTQFERAAGKRHPLASPTGRCRNIRSLRFTMSCQPVYQPIYCAARPESSQKVLGLPEGCNTMLLHTFLALFVRAYPISV
jgi:hypothetical protein